MVKVILDRAQSGGDQISVINDGGKIKFQKRIHLLPEKDDILILDVDLIFRSDIDKEIHTVIHKTQLDKQKVEAAINKARLGKVNAYTNADFEGFIDEDILKKELKLT